MYTLNVPMGSPFQISKYATQKMSFQRMSDSSVTFSGLRGLFMAHSNMYNLNSTQSYIRLSNSESHTSKQVIAAELHTVYINVRKFTFRPHIFTKQGLIGLNLALIKLGLQKLTFVN